MSDTPMYPNWFDSQKYNFENHLTQFKGKPDLKFLQVGTYTGDASDWLLSTILTDPSSTLTDVDTWQGSDEREHKAMDFNKIYTLYLQRMDKYENLMSIKGDSSYILPSLRERYDFIYIDGDHTEKAVYRDATNAWALLKSGGVLAFDDYLWGQDVHPELRPGPAIDKFLEEKQGEYELLSQDYQVWIRRNDK
jgi:predicted O-methyltransferase YrrM